MAFALSACQSNSVRFSSLAVRNDQRPEISARLFKPEGAGPFPAVVLLPACGGADRSHVSSTWPDFLVNRGYAVLTVASYSSRGYYQCFNVPKSQWLSDQAEDAYGALDYLAAQPFIDARNVAVIGFSAGGFAINERIFSGYPPARWNAPGKPRFRAAVAVYAGCFMWPASARLPLLQIAAERDQRLARSCRNAASRIDMELHEIKDAYHAFDQREIRGLRQDNAGNPMMYSSAATREALAVVDRFLARHLRQ